MAMVLSSEEAASLSASALPATIFAALEGLAHMPNERKSHRSKEAHWLPVTDTETRTLQTPCVLVEQVVQYIYRHVLPFELPELKGVEWWLHSRQPTEKMHVSCRRRRHLLHLLAIMMPRHLPWLSYCHTT
jgi:hypothetical protein